jgi:predicted PurR-regulated permease PerM
LCDDGRRTYNAAMAQAARRDDPGESPDLWRVAKTTAVVVAVVASAALVATILVLGAQMLLVGFLGILCALVFVTISRPVARRLHMKRKYAFAMVVALTFLALGALLFFTGEQLVSQFDELVSRSSETFTTLQAKAKSLPAPIGGRNGAASGNTAPPAAPEVVAGAMKVVSTIAGVGSALLLVALMSFFCGYAPEEYVDAGIKLLPESWQERAWALSDATYGDLKQWLFAQLFTMAFDAVFVLVGLMIVGIKLAPVLAIITGVCGFVPYLGAFVAPIPGILVVLGEDPSKLPFVIGVYFAVQMIEGWIVTPLVQKKRSNIPPGLLLFFQALIGLVAGPLGVVVATPLLVIIMTWVRVLWVERGD